MSIQIPSEVESNSEYFFPKLAAVRNQVDRLESSGLNFASRAKGIYQIIELLVHDGRLDRSVLSEDICCLDVGSSAPEAPVFLALGSRSVTLTEGYGPEPSFRVDEPRLRILGSEALETLAAANDRSFNYITMFNTFNPLFRFEEKRADLIRSLSRVLRPGGHFTVTADGTQVGFQELQALEGEIARGRASDSLHITFPSNRREPMWGKGWVMRSILVENVLGFSYDDLNQKPCDDYLDGAILTAIKMSSS